jgi:tetratricopeptide (TPR) repeat protein
MYAVQRYPTSARLHVGLGVAYYSLGRYDEAVETLCQAVDLDPQDTRALDFLGKMAEISPKYAEAVTKRLAGFVRAYPRSAVAQYYYGVALRKHNLAPSSAHDREAEPYLARAVQLKPDFPEAHFELGTLYQDRGEDAKAIRQLEIATLQRPQFLPAHYRLARLYQKVGRRDMARHEFARIEELKERVAKSAQ